MDNFEVDDKSGSKIAVSRMKNYRVASYWEHFYLVNPHQDVSRTFEPKEATTLFCKLCESQIDIVKGNRLTDIRKHLQKEHPLAYGSLVESLEKKKQDSQARKRNLDLGNRVSVKGVYRNTRHKSTGVIPAQISFEKPVGALQNNFNKRVTRWINEALLPFSIGDDPNARDAFFYAQANQGMFEFPSSKIIAKCTKELAAKQRLVVRDTINTEAFYFSLTSDFWASRAKHSYMALTLHYCTRDFQIREFTLGVFPFKGSHTGLKISQEINKFCTWWGLNILERCIVFVTDNAANMKSGIRKISHKLPNPGCAAHTLHLIVTDTLVKELSDATKAGMSQDLVDALELVRGVIEKVRELARHFKRSLHATEQLRDLQDSEKPLEIKLDVSTRWNSILAMLDRVLKLESKLTIYFENNKSSNLEI